MKRAKEEHFAARGINQWDKSDPAEPQMSPNAAAYNGGESTMHAWHAVVTPNLSRTAARRVDAAGTSSPAGAAAG